MKDFIAGIEKSANQVALTILDIFDVQVAAVLSLFLLVVMILISRVVRRRSPTRWEILQGVLAIMSGFTVIPIVCVFLLTKPPAIEKLSEDSRVLVGLICTVVIGMLSISELRAVFFKRPSAPPASTGSPR